MSIRTIFQMSEDCARGDRQGWHEFIRDYAGLTRTLLHHYFPALEPELSQHVLGVFQRAREGNNEWFRGIHFANEREFLMAFRELVFAYGREHARLPAPPVSLEQMRAVMADLTVVERELLWLFVKGYNAEQIAPMMMNAAATAQAAKNKADQKLAAILPTANADSFRLSARVLMEEAERTRGEKCLPLRTFNNLVNGQITWRERELAEQHINDCLNCLDRYTGFQEMIRLRKDARPLPDSEIEAMLDRLGIKQRKGVLAKLLAR
jgi:AcrR family transcriptional regulator